MNAGNIFNNSPPSFSGIPSNVQYRGQGSDYRWGIFFSKNGSYKDFIDNMGLDINPDFQRGHVWSESQQKSYIEFCLKGGVGSKVIYLNCPDWDSGGISDFVLVDGKQRLEAARKFSQNELKVFGYYNNEYVDKMDPFKATFRININTLQSREEVIKWYLEMNSGGTPHSEEELTRVNALLSKELSYRERQQESSISLDI